LATQDSSNENFNLKIQHLSALIFFSADEIPDNLNKLKLHLPEEGSEVTDWFGYNYGHSEIKTFRQRCCFLITTIFSNKFVVCISMQNGFLCT
jgi:hypothetical protein